MAPARSPLPWLLAGVSLGLACSAPPPEVKKPPPPDMSELIAAYEAPTAELDPETAAEVLEAVDALVAQLGDLGLTDQLLDTINTTIDEQLERTGETSSALGVEQGEQLEKLQQRAIKGGAYLLATRICGGFGAEPVPDPLNGKITLTVGLSGDALDPVMWGQFAGCKYRFSESQVELTGQREDEPGSYSIYVGETLKLGDFALSTILMQLSVWAELNGNGQLLEADFRINVESLALDLRIPVEGGHVIAHADSTLVGVSATNGEFSCDAEARACSAGDQTIEF
jgi:hypothetical protein